MRKIILVGGGGHCESCIDVVKAEDKFEIAGIVDTKKKLGKKVLGCEVIACDEDLPKLVKKYKYFLITIGQIKTMNIRKEKFEYLKNLGAKFPVIISPFAYIAKNVSIDEGTIIMHKAIVNVNARVGKNCIVNTAALVEHDVNIGNHCHISTGAVINGSCLIKEGVFIGSNAVIANNLTIAKNTVIGAGSVGVKSISKRGIYVGNPLRRLCENA
jgi:sugar O-acyltransferase (sialic acid O-acetyltransferase NeuD family)